MDEQTKMDRHSNFLTCKIASAAAACFRYHLRTSGVHTNRFAEKLRTALHWEMYGSPLGKMAIEQRIDLHWQDAERATSLPTLATCPRAPHLSVATLLAIWKRRDAEGAETKRPQTSAFLCGLCPL